MAGKASIWRLAALAATALTALPVSAEPKPDATASTLEDQFRDPPAEARPRMWWHWLDGNVSEDGIRKDLAWMKSIGIGGVQTFDISFMTPNVVDHPLKYMSSGWKDAFRTAATEADRLGLELAIASSPGWSETGGPWVPAADGMKKLAWSETIVSGGRKFSGKLPLPPTTTGPFQDLPLVREFGADPSKADPTYFADVAVIAYPLAEQPEATPPVYSVAGKNIDTALLTDGLYAASTQPLKSEASGSVTIDIAYPRSQTIRSAQLFAPGAADTYLGPFLIATLEAETGPQSWQQVAKIKTGLTPTTAAFPPVAARHFRVRISRIEGTAPPVDSAPGFLGFMPPSTPSGLSVRLAELKLSSDARIDQFETKAGFAVALNYTAMKQPEGSTEGVDPSKVIDLTTRLQADGTLDWSPPRGTWRVLRLGYSLTGKTNHPAPRDATGLEVDKLDAQAVRRYLDTYLGNYRNVVGPDLLGKKGVSALLTDSTEVGAFNWTPRLIELFEQARGYDPRPWLPALIGTVVKSRKASDAFLYDFRKTIAELHASAHYGTIAKVAHENGLKVYGESLEGWRVSLGDDMDMRRYTDVPMAANWSFLRERGPRPSYIADMRGAASVAHLYGQEYVAAESMTSTRYPWAQAPNDLKRVVDLEFANGVNRIVYHTSPHQPTDDKLPGLSLRHIGQFFTRHETWASLAKPWVDYMARNSLLLQQGHDVADVAYFYGEDAPVGAQVSNGYFTDLPKGYAYDFVNAQALQSALTVEGSTLVAGGGGRYRLLYLGGTSRSMTLATLKRIEQLVEQGANVLGDPPAGSPDLSDYSKEYHDIVGRLWPGSPVTIVGKGRVFAGKNIDSTLGATGVAPSLSCTKAQICEGIDFVERRLDDGETWFLVNRSNQPRQIEARFRVSGKAPQFWRPESGAIEPASYKIEGDTTLVPIKLGPEEAVHVVFRKPANQPTFDAGEREPEPVSRLEGSWKVAFEPGRGAPAAAELHELTPLDRNSDTGIRYFSGIATYTKEFRTPAGWRKGDRLWIDLGDVRELAEVSVNGIAVGTAWHAPYRLEISNAARAGRNHLQVRVANLWVNRLIGDAQPGAQKITWTAMPTYRADAPLRPSGLIGPVELMTVMR